jgi:hypothetical protein
MPERRQHRRRRQAPGRGRAPRRRAAGWGRPLPKDTALGLATSFGQERDMPTWVACVARVHVDRASGVVTVQKLTVVTDAGTIVDPDGALAQTEGAALWGLSMALHEGTEFVNGQVKDDESRHLHAAADQPTRRTAGYPVRRQRRGAGRPGRTGDDGGRPGDRQRHLPRRRRAPAAYPDHAEAVRVP